MNGKPRRRPYINLPRMVIGEQELAYLLPLILAWLAKRGRTP